MHRVTFLGWLLFRQYETHESHSGYDFPWSPLAVFPFSSEPGYHNYHHLKNAGNYGTFFTFWDTLFNTNQSYKESLEIEENKK